MSLKFIHHFFLPNDANNHRPKLLHYKTLVFFILFFLAAEAFLVNAKTNYSAVLGAATDISVEMLLSLTNNERKSKDLPPLVFNQQLSKAALLKGTNMLEKDYWAHNAPDGTTPWKFIKEVNYDYVYAGENLARGFTNSEDIIEAWIDSPTHRDNMFSQNYRDIGFAVLEGELVGEDTTLVVEMFGSTAPIEFARPPEEKNPAEVLPNLAGERSISLKNSPIINTISLSWYVGVGTVSFFIFIFVVDMVIIEKRKIVRFVGHNLDHITFLSLVLLFIVLVSRGAVL